MPVYDFLKSSYAMAVYLYGTRTILSLPEPYREPVKEYAAGKYSLSQIDNALSQGWITQQEYDETIALIPPSEPAPEL